MSNIKVLLVDDHSVVRQGLERMLELDSTIKIVGHANCGQSAISQAQQLSPDAILMDVKMPDMSGIEVTKELKAQGCPSNIIMLTVYGDTYVTQAAEAGAVGYLLKDIDREDLVQAIKAVCEGQSPLAPSITRCLFENLAVLSRANKNDLLTVRQIDVLRQIASGSTNREIGAQLYLSEATVKREANAIFCKLEVSDRAQAVAEAYRRDLF